MTQQEAYEKALKQVREIQLMGGVGSVLHWDMETYMPEGAAGFRGELLGTVAKVQHRLKTAPEFKEAVLTLDPEGARSAEDAAQIRRMQLEIFQSLAVTEEFSSALVEAQVACQNKWHEAKREKNFKLVEPELTQMVRLNQEYAQQLATYEPLKPYYQGRSLYEVLLDFYEPGFPAAELRRLLSELVKGTKELLPQILERAPKQVDETLFQREIPKQTELAKQVAKALGFDFKQGRLDTSAHPFCTNLAGDVRMTTRYDEKDFLDSLFSVIHETGHALYEQNLPLHLRFTPCGGAASSGIHESQSRFYENFIGRSPAFARFLAKQTGVDAKAILARLTEVKRSYIRVEADEVTYNLHIYLRFLLEEEMILGKLAVKDVAERWRHDFEKLFGLKVENDSQGVLQDVHWYGGAYGYFPTYSLGNLLAAELFTLLKKEQPDWEQAVEQGDFVAIREFQRKHIHEQAQLHSSPETIYRAIGKNIGTEALLTHFRERYLA